MPLSYVRFGKPKKNHESEKNAMTKGCFIVEISMQEGLAKIRDFLLVLLVFGVGKI